MTMLKDTIRDRFPFIPLELGDCQSVVFHNGGCYVAFSGVLYVVDEEGKKLTDVETAYNYEASGEKLVVDVIESHKPIADLDKNCDKKVDMG